MWTINVITLVFYWLCWEITSIFYEVDNGHKTHTVSWESSSSVHLDRSVTGAAVCLGALLDSLFSLLHWGKEHLPVHPLEICRRGTYPGSSALAPLLHRLKSVNICPPHGSDRNIKHWPWFRTPSSSSTCHIPTACAREWMHELCCICQSTNSVPTQHCLQK